MSNVPNTVPAFAIMAESYLDCATFVSSGMKSKSVSPRHDAPLYQLCAHGFELALKAVLLTADEDLGLPEAFGHDLIKLYDALKTANSTKATIINTEQFVKSRWKTLVTSARDVEKKRLLSWAPNHPDILKEFRIPSNQEIDEGVPQLKHQVRWFSDRHKSKGGLFRYQVPRIDTRLNINICGLDEDAATNSIIWAGYELCKRSMEGTRKERQRRTR